MVTILEREIQSEQTTGHNNCSGCPRCEQSNTSTCTIPHPRFANRHPVCKVCGHCVLRGKHKDDASDLDDHPGFINNPSITYNLN